MQMLSKKPGVKPWPLEFQTQSSFTPIQLLLPRTWEVLEKYLPSDSHSLPGPRPCLWPPAKARPQGLKPDNCSRPHSGPCSLLSLLGSQNGSIKGKLQGHVDHSFPNVKLWPGASPWPLLFISQWWSQTHAAFWEGVGMGYWWGCRVEIRLSFITEVTHKFGLIHKPVHMGGIQTDTGFYGDP